MSLSFRNLKPEDVPVLRQLVAATRFFTPQEIEVAVELMEDISGGYKFVVAEEAGAIVGYSCYGHVEITESAYDLYWIVVARRGQGKGVGKQLMAETEAQVRKAGGTHLYAETSSRKLYAPTRRFYEQCGFFKEAELKDFYRAGDHRITYTKIL